MTITLNGESRELHYQFRALRALGLKGPSDAEGISRILNGALTEWESLTRLIAAGMGRAATADCADIEAMIDEWDLGDVKRFMEGIAGAFGVDVSEGAVTEGEQSGPPAPSNHGSNAEPSPDTTSG